MKNINIKYARYIILSILLLLCVGVVSSCHAMYPIDISVSGDDLSDKNIDLLVKLKDKSYYIYQKQCIFGYDPLIKITDDSEIANYDTDGYRSINFHYYTENRYEESKKDNYVSVKIYLNGKSQFKDLCNNCISFKIALIDNNGKILQVSNECKMEKKTNVIADKLNYDCSTNTLKTKYKYNRSSSIVLLEAFFLVLMILMPISSLICLGILIIKKSRQNTQFPKLMHCITTFLPCIPLLVYLGFRLDYALKTENSILSIFKEYVETFNLGFAIYCLIPIIVYAAVLIWYSIETSKNTKPQQENSQSNSD